METISPSGSTNSSHDAEPVVPEISVVITAYNYGRFLGKAIESVVSQDFADVELLILNNASTDDTDEVVKKYLGDPRIRYIVNETNIGALANGQKGLACARAPFILFLSADDYLLPGALSTLHRAITADASLDFVYAKYMFVDINGAVINDNISHPGWLPYSHKGRANELADLLQFDCYISMPTVLFKRATLERFGKFSDKVRVADYELFLRLAAGGCVALFLNEIVAAFRVHGNQLSVGGDVVSSGSQVNDQLTLLEMYVTEEHFQALAGYEAGIINLLASKVESFNRHPQKNLETAAAMQRRLQAVSALVSRLGGAVPEHYPMVSVIIPTLNRPDTLKRAVYSVLSQTYSNFEIIVVNDGGDDVEHVLKPLNAGNAITCIRHETTRERSAARNTGLGAAKGKYIAYLDDDDRFYPDHLRILVNFLQSHKVKAAYTDAYRAVEELKNGAYIVQQRQLLYSCPFDPNRLLVENLFPTLCVMHEKACIDELGMFDESYQTHEDWELWIRLSRTFCFHHIPVVTAEYSYRNHKTNTSTARLAEFNETRKRIYRQYRQYAQLHPGIIEAQNRALSLHADAVSASLSVFDFMDAVTRFVEANNHAKALSYYDQHRKSFGSTAELEKFDSLVAIIRTRELSPVRQGGKGGWAI